jgi:CarD family transcriptional regulator
MKAAAGTAVARQSGTHAANDTKPAAGKAAHPPKAHPKAAPIPVRKPLAVAQAATAVPKTAEPRVPASRKPAAPVAAAPSKAATPARRSAEVEEIEEDRPEEKPASATQSAPEQAPAPAPMRGPQHGPVQIPRPMAKAEVFVEGDHVVYPTHGVGKVERIAIEEIAGHKLELIHITFEENRMTLRVPVAKARSAGLRKLATRKMFDEALAVLRGRARVKRTMWSRRAQEYEAKINSGDPLAIAEVVRDLHRNAGQPDQSFSERQIYEAAMDRLAAELAALDKTDKTTAATKLADFLKTV